MAKMEIAPGERARVRLACLRMLATLRLERRKMQVVLGFIDSYLRLNPEEEKALQAEYEKLAATEKKKMMEVTILWKEEGRQEGTAEIVIGMVESRFGPVAPATSDLIYRLSSDQLQKLSRVLWGFTSIGDLAKWLQDPPPPLD